MKVIRSPYSSFSSGQQGFGRAAGFAFEVQELHQLGLLRWPGSSRGGCLPDQLASAAADGAAGAGLLAVRRRVPDHPGARPERQARPRSRWRTASCRRSTAFVQSMRPASLSRGRAGASVVRCLRYRERCRRRSVSVRADSSPPAACIAAQQALASPGVEALPDGDAGDDQRGAGVCPPPAQGAVQDQARPAGPRTGRCTAGSAWSQRRRCRSRVPGRRGAGPRTGPA